MPRKYVRKRRVYKVDIQVIDDYEVGDAADHVYAKTNNRITAALGWIGRNAWAIVIGIIGSLIASGIVMLYAHP